MNRFARLIVTGALALSPLLVVTAPAEAAPGRYFSSCANLSKVFPNGVAKNKKAANRQVRQGNRRPAHGKRARAVYKRNYTRLDRDRDGTACERS